MNPSIAIVGSGPGGLTLARLLHQANIKYTIFDLRSEPSLSSPSALSGSLDLHVESGQLALQACGLHEDFLKLTRQGSEDMLIMDKTSHIGFADEGNPHDSRPEIDRKQLIELLLSSIPADSIHWNHKVISVKPRPSNRWTINFEGRPSLSFDMVVGADGAWSCVRQILTQTKPHYSGVNCITMNILSIDISHPTLAKLVGRGSLFACGDHKALICQRGSQNSVRVYVMLSSPSTSYLSSEKLDALPLPELKHTLVNNPAYFKDWATDLKALILAASEDLKHYIPPKPLYMLPIGHT